MIEVALETARDLHASGVMKKATLREVEELCLPRRTEFAPADIRRIRLSNNLTQALFARYLNVGVSTA